MEQITHNTLFGETIQAYADIVLPLPLPQLFTYAVPRGIDAVIGARVVVPFGQRKILTGIVKSVHHSKPELYEAKAILEVLDSHPIITETQFKLMDWISSYYMCTVGEVMNAMLPTGFKLSSQTRMQLHPQWMEFILETQIDEREQKIIDVLKLNESVELEKTEDILGIKAFQRYIKSLLAKRLIIVFEALKEKY